MKTVAQLVALIILAASAAVSAPLVTDAGDQYDPDIYGRYVVYDDFRYHGSVGTAVVLIDLETNQKTIVNPTWEADNRPAVGEDRVIWCDRRWDGTFAVVSTVIGSGVEDLLTYDRGSAWGLDVNDRWAVWYDCSEIGERYVRAYSFATRSAFTLQTTYSDITYLDPTVHIDHSSDSLLWKDVQGRYWGIDLATQAATPSTEHAYNASRHGSYNGVSVWSEHGSDLTGMDIFVSHAPEPSSFVALVSGGAILCLRRRRA